MHMTSQSADVLVLQQLSGVNTAKPPKIQLKDEKAVVQLTVTDTIEAQLINNLMQTVLTALATTV